MNNVLKFRIFNLILPLITLFFLLLSLNDHNILSFAKEVNNSSYTSDCIENSKNPIELGQTFRIASGTLFLWYQCTVPATIHVGDYFTIYALIWPISHRDIEINSTGPYCGNPLTVEFDKNVQIKEVSKDENLCNPLYSKQLIEMGNWVTLSTSPFANLPASGITSYLATSAGNTNGTLELKYREVGNASIASIAESFELNILPLPNSTNTS